MMVHLGGPETPEKIAERHARYLALSGGDRMFRIVDAATGAAAGSVGYWRREWQGRDVYEIGWLVVPELQGRGLARSATAQALAHAREHGTRPAVHAYPNVDNGPSNAICARLGFTLVGACDVEYPPGHHMRCHDWRYDLAPSSAEPSPPTEAP